MTILREGSAKDAGFDPDRIEMVRRRAKDWVSRGDTPSLVLLAARNGVICLHEAFGSLTFEPDTPPLAVDSIFSIASNSKPVTATAVMQLVEDGLLALNKPLVEYIPEMTGERSQEILVRQLLTHTSGFAMDDDTEYMNRRLEEGVDLPPCEDNQHPSIHSSLHTIYGMPTWKAPGAQMSYSGVNYMLLGEIVRRISGVAFSQFVRERIFDPLGMQDSSFVYEDDFEGRMVRRDPKAPPPVEGLPMDEAAVRARWRTPNPAGGMVSTAADYAAFAQMILNGGQYGDARVLSSASVREMTRNQIPGIGTDFFGTWYDEASWGLGFRVLGNTRWPDFDGSLTSLGSVGHGGAGGCEWWVDPPRQIVGMYFSVSLDVDHKTNEMRMYFDRFQDLLSAAALD